MSKAAGSVIRSALKPATEPTSISTKASRQPAMPAALARSPNWMLRVVT